MLCPAHAGAAGRGGVTVLEDTSGGAPGGCALKPPGPLQQVHLHFQFEAVFLTLCRHSYTELLLLVTACC